MARAKYALGYGSFFLSYVCAALLSARYPSPSKSGSMTDFCHEGRWATKYLASILTNGMYSIARLCLDFDNFDFFFVRI